MTRNETKCLLGLIVTAYPGSKIAADDRTVDLWWEMLQDLPADVAAAATKAMFATLKYAPSIADIREAVARSVSDARGDITAGEAWGKVRKAITRYGYYRSDAAHAALGDALWAALEQIGGWAYVCTTEDPESVLSAQFERRYEAQHAQEQRQLQIPAQVREHLMALGAGRMVKGIEGMVQ
jgi:hypothetical protein